MNRHESAFDIITEDKAERELLRMRSTLMHGIVSRIKELGLTQKEAAKIIGCGQPRISRLKSGRISEFGLNWLTKAKLKLNGKVK